MADPRLPRSRQWLLNLVITRGTPPRLEGCRPASRGLKLALMTKLQFIARRRRDATSLPSATVRDHHRGGFARSSGNGVQASAGGFAYDGRLNIRPNTIGQCTVVRPSTGSVVIRTAPIAVSGPNGLRHRFHTTDRSNPPIYFKFDSAISSCT
jgi:hypothetical protein